MYGFGDGIVGDCIDQADGECSLCRYFLGGDEQLKRSSLPDQAWQALRSSPASDEAERSAAMAKHRVGRGNSAMTGERQVESSAHAMAFDGSDDRSGKRRDGIHQSLTHLGECVGFGTA